MKVIVLYTSKYGSTETYARWIAEALKCSAKRLQDVQRQELTDYDVILYGGGLYASGIAGLKKFLTLMNDVEDKRLILFMVGMTNPSEASVYTEIAERDLTSEWIGRFETFAFRGNILFSKLSWLHKLMMKVPKSELEKKPMAERTEEDQLFLEMFGKDVIFTDKEQIKPLLNALQLNGPSYEIDRLR